MKLNNDILKIGLNRIKVLPIGEGEVTPKLKLVFFSELAKLGFKVSNPQAYNDSVLENFDTIMSSLSKMKGGDVDYVPLFNGFPNNVPEKNEFFVKRMVGFLGNVMGLFDEGETMDNGIIVPEWLFNLDDFSADPIVGRQSSELYNKGVENQKSRKSDFHTEWTTLELVSENEINNMLENYLCSNLYSKSSIKETLKNDIEFLIDYIGLSNVESKKVLFKETKSYIMAKLWKINDYETLRSYVGSPTDILRMFASLTDTDISLSTNIKFPKMKRVQRRFILESLNTSSNSNLAEDLNMYKGLWLELGRYLHPGEYKGRYPEAFKAFDTIRNGNVITFNSKVEKAIEDKDLSLTLDLLSTKPGIFGRKLHQLLTMFDSGSYTEKILSIFNKISTKLELKNLLVLETYFKTIDSSPYRSIINKKGKVIVINNNKQHKLNDDVSKVVESIQSAIRIKLSSNEDLSKTKVWVDPNLTNYTIPLQQRKMSDGLISLGRGSKLRFDGEKVLRMFTYWKQSEHMSDLDLSLILFDENMEEVDQVSYTNLSTNGIVHSGDITSAPHGSAEFIDIELDKIEDNVRYLAIQIFRFSGENFMELDKSYAGWMFRERTDSNIKSFDIKTVQNKFNVSGQGNYSMPMVVDIKTQEIIFIDMYMSGRSNNYNSNEGAIHDISIVTKELVKMIETRPNMFDLVQHHMEGSKANLVEEKSEAELTYGIEDCNFNVTNVEEILSEML